MMAKGSEAHVPLTEDGSTNLKEALEKADETLRPVLLALLNSLDEEHRPESMMSSDVRLG